MKTKKTPAPKRAGTEAARVRVWTKRFLAVVGDDPAKQRLLFALFDVIAPVKRSRKQRLRRAV